MAPHGVTPKSSYKYLEAITDGFSKENLIGKFQFGKVYRGKLNSDDGPRYCTVKIWEIPEIYRYNDGDNEDRLRDELSLLEHEKFNFHPGLVKLFGYCRDGEKLGIIYDLKPLDTVHNLVLKDSFTWVQRIKVALRFAGLLKFFHGQNPICRQFMVRNISAAHIMLDEDYNPKLFDFGMISGGIFPDRTLPPVDLVFGCYGYISPVFGFAGWCAACDTFAFGVLLLMLISKRVFDEDRDDDGSEVHQWATTEYNSKNTTTGFGQSGCSLVHKSLEEEPAYCSRDGRHITKLAMQCLEPYIWDRPTMKQVVKCLQNLRVVRRHALTPM